jgi:hypothetical protein
MNGTALAEIPLRPGAVGKATASSSGAKSTLLVGTFVCDRVCGELLISPESTIRHTYLAYSSVRSHAEGIA